MASGLVVRVLGPIAAERDGEPAVLGGSRPRAVLARLVLAGGRLVPTERLIEDLWGEAAPRSAHGTLQSYVSVLRRVLGQGVLRREGPGYLLDLPADRVDVLQFEQLVAAGLERSASDPVGALGDLESALSLWRGPAYADVADEPWATSAAVRLEGLRLAAMVARFDALLAVGRHAGAVAELERAVEDHPFDERLAAQLLVALYHCGRQTEALQAADRTRRRLRDEMGLSPGPELARVESAVLAHEAWLAAPTAPTPAPAAAAPSTALPEAVPAGPASASPVALPPAAARAAARTFVGRASSLEVLREAWTGALAGERRLVVLSGEAGAGKTTLAARFAAEAHEAGAIVLWGRASSQAIVPYEPVVEALRTVLRTVSPEARERVATGRDALALLLPDLADLVPGVEVARPEVGSERYVLFETVAGLLEAESAAWPVVFVLDDLHCADELSLRLLEHLLRHERPARVLLVATVVASGPASSSPLDAFLAGLHRDGLLTRLAVGGLAREEVAELLAAEGWERAGSAAAIHRATGGNPFFVTELAEHGGGAVPDRLPQSVREVLGARLERLDPAAARLVAVAAVAGPVVSLPVLVQASGLDGPDVFDAIDAALDAGVLTEDGPPGTVSFVHALVRQAALERLSRSRRSALHLAVADALAVVEGTSPQELAQHLLDAGGLAPRDRVVEAALTAGRDALGSLAYEDAERWAQRALDAAGSEPPPVLGCEAMLLWSDAHRALGGREAARAAASAAAEAARAARDPLLLARAAEALALARAGLGFDFGTVDPEVDALLAEALAALPETETSQRARLLGASLASAGAEGDSKAISDLSEQVLALAETQDVPVLLATAHLARRMASWKRDLLEERLAADRAALAAAQKARRTPLELNALLYGVTDLTEAGEAEEAEVWFRRYRERAAEVRQPVYDAFGLFLEATRRLARGQYDRARELSDEALARGRESHGANAEQAWAGQAFVRAWDQGQLAGLVDVLAAAVERPPGLTVWRIGWALALVETGRAEEARPVLQRFVTPEGIDLPDDTLWTTAGTLLAEIACALGDAERAAVLQRSLAPYAGRVVISGLGRVTFGPVARAAGLGALVAGDLPAADALLTRSADVCRRFRAVPLLARTLADHALVLDGLGRTAAAARAADEARMLAASVGLVLPTRAASTPARVATS